ncbi:glycerophosphodiester phosphodiesterase family protein [Enterococcus innesii]|uniref:glycerophosphodiester phosphodiesterase family protein n=1 Tax=Enterococcus innesii TaxID=2839759 RepID=UPI00232D1AD3|nr:glycerophosphodiester phosphodiesterase family protein [Enterococcus innesii]MDC0753219.1 glycerophosphodiester phosphodiesterase family protein [Enterococcus innesii]MDC0777308.1 glycerophosphodiester phosphodiesterase family protein [Enterococcus innesii]MDC0780519.1 glycerophosphodiester phosphodiesterase family protein [Enterococcus innesii]MDC0784052.1 glycerophosphodiester phosphodiesterase family protein [Enterococcus innesii]
MAKQWKNEDIIYPEDAQRWESGLENVQQNNAQNETNLKKHSDDKLNPHNVTAAQTGAYAKAEVDTKDVSVLSTAKAYTDLHSVKKDNPHGVTAAQVGAYSKAEADSNLTAALLPKTNSRGYSNGTVTDISGVDLNSLNETGTFMGSALTNAPSSSWWFITNLVHTSNYITQIAYVVSATTDRPRVRKKSNGIWGEWQTIMFTSDNAVSSSKLQSPRQIAGVDFDGTKDIAIPANNVGAYTKTETDSKLVNTKNEIISGNVASASKLQSQRKINGISFDGTSDISITADPNQKTIPANTNLDNLTTPGFWTSVSDGNTGTLTNAPFGTGTFTLQVETGLNDTRIIQTAKRATNGDIAIRSKTESAAWRPWVALAKNDGNIQAGLVAEKASRLANPRTIAGVQFDGTSNIEISADNVGAYSKEQVNTRHRSNTIKTNYVSHRGMSILAPENSLKAFDFVTRHSAIETDIQVTSDGVWICMHDLTVDRTTNGTGSVASKTLAQMKALRIDSIENPHNNIQVNSFNDIDLKVPTFEEYLVICRSRGKVPVVEIKKSSYTAANYQNLVNILKKHRMESTAIIISTEISILSSIRNLLPNIHVQQVIQEISQSILNSIASLGTPCGIAVKYDSSSVTQTNIDLAKSLGLTLNLWTVPKTEFARLEAYGIDFITTDEMSGTRKYEFLDDSKMKNAWKDYFSNSNAPNPSKSYVEELDDGTIHVHLHVRDGNKTKGLPVCVLPEWAWPQAEIWGTATLRTSNNIAMGTCDILGYVSMKDSINAGLSPGSIVVGLGWEQGSGSNWVRADFVYNPAF